MFKSGVQERSSDFNGKYFEVETTRMDAEMPDGDFFTSPSPSSPPALLHCDYSDWSPSFSIIPSVYLLAFLVGCLGNSLVLWAYVDRPERRRAKTGDKSMTGKLCCAGAFRSSRPNVGSFPQRSKQNSGNTSERSCRASSTSSSYPPSTPRASRSLTDSLIASLALADLCFLVTLPLWAVYTAMGYHWPFGQPLCQISSFLTALNMYASVFSLSMLSVERYWVLTGRRPLSHHTAQGCRSRALWILGGVWALAGVLALPGLLLRSVREVEMESEFEDDWQVESVYPTDSGSVLLSCQMDYSMLIGAELNETDRERAEMWWAAALSIKSTLIGFLLPLAILLVCYCSLARLLSRHFGQGPRPDRRRQRRLLRVIVSLVLAFFLCWLPLHVNKTVSMLLEFGFVQYSCSLDQLLLGAQPYVTCLAYLNSCLNPLLYAACDPSFRKRCRGAIVTLCRLSRLTRRGAEGKEGTVGEGEEQREERSSAFPSGTQEETADRTEGAEEERVGPVGGIRPEAV